MREKEGIAGDALAVALEALMTRARIGREALALESGLGRDSIGRWVRGEAVPTLASLRKVETCLSGLLGEAVDLSAERDARASRRHAVRPGRAVGQPLRDYLATLLAADYIWTGALGGEFAGFADRRSEAFYQQEGAEERPALKPSYFPTYWGLVGARHLFPAESDRYESRTAEAIEARFGEEAWLRVPLADYEAPPTLFVSDLVRVRHTARAASILLLCQRNLRLASDIVWALVRELPALCDGGVPELLVGSREPSIHASAAVLQALSHAADCPALADPRAFRAESRPFADQIVHYLAAEWDRNRWAFGAIPWQVNAPPLLADLAPCIGGELRGKIAGELREEFLPSGRLKDRRLDRFDARGPILDLRTAFAVSRDPARKGDERLQRVICRLAAMRWDDQPLRTADITFLALLIDYSTR